MSSSPHRWSAAVAVALAFAVVLGACSSGGSSSDNSAPGGDSSSSATEPAEVGAGWGSLEDLAFDEGDLAEGEQFVVPADGTTVSDASPSLAFCQFDLPAEADRDARHRVQVLGADFGPVATTEAVRYASGAATAMTELRGAFMDCPEGEGVDVGEGELITYAAVPVQEDELGGLTQDHVGADITATTADGTVEESTLIAQRRGEVIVVVEGADHDRVVELATTAGARLAAADASAVGD